MKDMSMVVTMGWSQLFSEVDPVRYAELVRSLFYGDYPFQHFSFDCDFATNEMVISVSGMNYETEECFVESREIHREASRSFTPFWFIVDDYGDNFVGTFLLPSEY